MFSSIAPGIAGLYMSAVFGATLSTTSSSINSCSVVIIEDIMKDSELSFSKIRFELYFVNLIAASNELESSVYPLLFKVFHGHGRCCDYRLRLLIEKL